MEWDFFISYTTSDQGWAEWIAWELEAAGYRVLVQAWDFVPGSHWTTRMREGISGAKHTLAILSDAYLTSVYGQAEWQAAYRADPQGFSRRLIPVRVENCARPDLLGEIVSFDLFDCPVDVARRRLLDTIAVVLAGRAKPSTAPAFPKPAPAGATPPPTKSPRVRPPQQPAAEPRFPGEISSRRPAGRGTRVDRLDSRGEPAPAYTKRRRRGRTGWVVIALLIVAFAIAIATADRGTPPGGAQPSPSTRTGSNTPNRVTPSPATGSSHPPGPVLIQGTLRMRSPDVADLERRRAGPAVTESDLYLFCSSGQCLLSAAGGLATTPTKPATKAACTAALNARDDSPLNLPQLRAAMTSAETLCVQTNQFHIAALQIRGIPGPGTGELSFTYILWR